MSFNEIFDWLVANKDTANAIATIASAVMAAVAVVLSLISLAVSLAALRHQRKHNQLSVRPLAYVTLGDYEDRLYVIVRNNGTGPLIVRSITIIGAKNPSQPLFTAMPALLPKVSWTNFVEDCTGRSVPAGGELVLLDLSLGSSASQGQFAISRDVVRRALGVLQVSVTYTDIYGTRLPSSQRNLNFFHRNLGDL